jgi:hypothetical protein
MARIALFLFVACTGALAQSRIRESGAKAGLRALSAIDQDPKSEDSRMALRDQLQGCPVPNMEKWQLALVRVFEMAKNRENSPLHASNNRRSVPSEPHPGVPTSACARNSRNSRSRGPAQLWIIPTLIKRLKCKERDVRRDLLVGAVLLAVI